MKNLRREGKGLRFFSINLALIVGIALIVGLGCEFRHLPEIPKTWTQMKWAEFDPDFTYNGLSPSCSSCPGTNPEFSFFVKGGKTNNLVVYFEGGGACWDTITCYYARTYTQQVGMTVDTLNVLAEDPDGKGGILNFAREENPFKDWSFVYIPYCTGDIHTGAKDTAYPLPTGTSVNIRHRGFVNLQLVLKWMEDTLGKPKKIFITGSSAGAYGAVASFPFIREVFDKSKVYVLSDAGSGVAPTNMKQKQDECWDIQVPEWIPAAKNGYDPSKPYAETFISYARYYPFSRVGQFNNAWDRTQAWFYNLQLNDENGIPYYMQPAKWGPLPLTGAWCDWNNLMLYNTRTPADKAHNYRYYIAAGTTHTIMLSQIFYTENSGGKPYVEWVDSMIQEPFDKIDSFFKACSWKNQECTDCGATVTCP